jgi:hypothetical protein
VRAEPSPMSIMGVFQSVWYLLALLLLAFELMVVWFLLGPGHPGRAPTRAVRVDFPVGHRRRRAEAAPLLRMKFEGAVRGHFSAARADEVIALFSSPARLDDTPLTQFMGSFAP